MRLKSIVLYIMYIGSLGLAFCESTDQPPATITAIMNKLYHLGFVVNVEMGNTYPTFQLTDLQTANNPVTALEVLRPILKQQGFDFDVKDKMITIYDKSLYEMGDRYSLNKAFSLKVKDSSVRDCLKKVEAAIGVKIVLLSFGGDSKKKITLNSKLTFREVLNEIATETRCRGWTATTDFTQDHVPCIVLSL